MSEPDGFASAAPVSPVQESPAQKMDQMYRWTRHVYDLTRRYYLLGRDQLLSRIADRPAGRVLEIGCGTARNLRRLHHQAPRHSLYGLDVSRAMLATARRALRRMGCARAVTLRLGRAESWRPDDPFGGTAFDVIFFSYALSMIPAWPTALRTALTHLRPGGRLYVVDFWDQAGLPGWVARIVQGWLSLFDVSPRCSLVPRLRALDDRGRLACTVRPVARRYAYLVSVAPTASPGTPW